ncbi:MAG: hypothetical protein AAFP84_13060 [Actinomycetota bacterium]
MTHAKHDIATTDPNPPMGHDTSEPIPVRQLLSTLWIAVLLADVLRGIHETLRPGFVRELAQEGTVYGNTVTDGALAIYGVMLGYFSVLVVLSRVLPRRPNQWANIIGAAMMIAGVAVSWPKDPDDLIFGALQVAGSALIIVTCLRWAGDSSTHAELSGSTTARPEAR